MPALHSAMVLCGHASVWSGAVYTVSRGAQAFNPFNHTQFFGPGAVEGNISSGSFGEAVSAMDPRLVELALRYRF